MRNQSIVVGVSTPPDKQFDNISLVKGPQMLPTFPHHQQVVSTPKPEDLSPPPARKNMQITVQVDDTDYNTYKVLQHVNQVYGGDGKPIRLNEKPEIHSDKSFSLV
jgi:hypothetical protein